MTIGHNVTCTSYYYGLCTWSITCTFMYQDLCTCACVYCMYCSAMCISGVAYQSVQYSAFLYSWLVSMTNLIASSPGYSIFSILRRKPGNGPGDKDWGFGRRTCTRMGGSSVISTMLESTFSLPPFLISSGVLPARAYSVGWLYQASLWQWARRLPLAVGPHEAVHADNGMDISRIPIGQLSQHAHRSCRGSARCCTRGEPQPLPSCWAVHGHWGEGQLLRQ